MDTPTLLDALNSVVSIPLVPYVDGVIDYDGHRKNIRYLMQNNYLSDNRPRVISIAGTSLIHHIAYEDQIKLMDAAGQEMGGEGILIAALVPNPINEAGRLIEAMSRLNRPPDAYLLMPLTGTYSPEGLYMQFMDFTETYGTRYGARFLYYYRKKSDLACVLSLINDSPHVIGVKVGTTEADVAPFVETLKPDKITMWGVGDRSTAAAELGAKGHTSGINIVVVRASDEINNAQRRGDYAAAREIEARVAPLEEIRFVNDRAHNYAAVLEAIIAGGFDDVTAGTGGPFNPRVPADVAGQIKAIMADIREYH